MFFHSKRFSRNKNQAWCHQDGSCTLVEIDELRFVVEIPNKKGESRGEPGIWAPRFFRVFKGNPKLDCLGNLFHLFMWENGIIAIWTIHEFLAFRNGFRCYELFYFFLWFLPFWRLNVVSFLTTQFLWVDKIKVLLLCVDTGPSHRTFPASLCWSWPLRMPLFKLSKVTHFSRAEVS